MTEPKAPQQGAPDERTAAPTPRAPEAETPPRVRPQGYAPAFSGTSGAAWVFRDLASI